LGEYPEVRYYPPNADLFFDVMTRLDEAASFDTVEAEMRELDGIRVSVATPRALYRLKKDTECPLDRQDAALRDRFNPTRTDVPVHKFRSAEEMNATRVAGTSESDFDRFLRHCARFRLIAPRRYPRGVFKFRTLAEAQAARARDARERTELLD
jgi:hypothetical protein